MRLTEEQNWHITLDYRYRPKISLTPLWTGPRKQLRSAETEDARI